MTFTPKQIELAVAAAQGPRTLANGIWRDVFERDAAAIAQQQADRIKALETALREIVAIETVTGGLDYEAGHEEGVTHCQDIAKAALDGDAS